MESLTTTSSHSAVASASASPKANTHVVTATTDEEPLHSPPYWQIPMRSNSSPSDAAGQKRAITLEDNTEETAEQYHALWAKSVNIDNYVVVGGAAPAIGSYVVWNCTVETLNGGPITLRKRYSEFHKLRQNLAKTFTSAGGALPELPPKSFLHRFQTKFLEKRKIGLAYFLNCVLLNPEFSSSPVLKEFVFS